MSSEFKWTDELACDFFRFCCQEHPLSDLSLLQRFKQRHTPQADVKIGTIKDENADKICPPSRDWEIVAFEVGNNIYSREKLQKEYFNVTGRMMFERVHEQEMPINAKIHSVKRLTDNSTWSFDDEIIYCGIKNKIIGFNVSANGNAIHVTLFDGTVESHAMLNDLKKSTQPKEETKPLSERITVQFIRCGSGIGGYYYNEFCTDAEIPKEKEEAIKQAIESVLNDDEIPKRSNLSDAKPFGNHFGYDKKPLFITEDGVGKLEGDCAFTVNDAFGLCDVHSITKYQAESKDYKRLIKWFHSKGKAEEYILLNKPCLSLNDIKWWIEKYFDYPNGISIEQLKELAKQNQQS